MARRYVDTLFLLAATSLFAATVNGALGYGYSSIMVPISLLVVSSRILNPSLVLDRGLRQLVRPRPRSSIGSQGLAARRARRDRRVARRRARQPRAGIDQRDWAKLVTYASLLPLILIQAAGVRWPIRRDRAVGVPFGTGVGVLYSMTTISGPPLALYFNNQGLAKDEFKAALAIVRVIESSTTLIAYIALGILTRESLPLIPALAPGVLIGLPLGFYLIRKLDAEVFRRICMSFDGWLVAFGLSRVLTQLNLLPTVWASQVMMLTLLIDFVLLRHFFVKRKRTPSQEPARPSSNLLLDVRQATKPGDPVASPVSPASPASPASPSWRKPSSPRTDDIANEPPLPAA